MFLLHKMVRTLQNMGKTVTVKLFPLMFKGSESSNKIFLNMLSYLSASDELNRPFVPQCSFILYHIKII